MRDSSPETNTGPYLVYEKFEFGIFHCPCSLLGVSDGRAISDEYRTQTVRFRSYLLPVLLTLLNWSRLKTLPVIVRDMSDDAAVLLMVDSNLQREQILPSERAFAYKMKLDALKRQGARSDLTSSQVGMKLQALDIVGQEAGDSRNQVHRFIRLTNLIPELLDMVDEKKISFNPAVELSYLDESQQRDFLEAMADTQNAPSLSQAQRLKKLAQEGHFSYDVAFAVMGEPKKDELDKVVIKNDTLRKYFPESSTPREMEEKIIGLLEESKTEKVVFRSDSIKKYFPSNYSSEQIENSILKMLDQRMKKRKHEAER